jgi:uncharacterized repeat protein (TIGR02543 family)
MEPKRKHLPYIFTMSLLGFLSFCLCAQGILFAFNTFSNKPKLEIAAAGWDGGALSNYTVASLGAGTNVIDRTTAGEQTLTLYAHNLYYFQVYGARGGHSSTIPNGHQGATGGNGGYAKGYYLVGDTNTDITVFAGSMGGDGRLFDHGDIGTSNLTGGHSNFNGTYGGNGISQQTFINGVVESGGGGSGGGASGIIAGNNTVLMVAGGGGGAGGGSAMSQGIAPPQKGGDGGGQNGAAGTGIGGGGAGTQTSHGSGGEASGGSVNLPGAAGNDNGGGNGGARMDTSSFRFDLGGGGGGAGGGVIRGKAGGGGGIGSGGGGSAGQSYLGDGIQGISDNGKDTQWAINNTVGRVIITRFEIATYTITYDLRGGEHVGTPPLSYNAQMSNPIVLGGATKFGYTFDGWYYWNGSTEVKVTSFNPTDRVNKSYYALWTPIPYTITYHKNGGTHSGAPAVYDMEYGTVTLVAPTKTGYAFGGWFDNAEFDGAAVTSFSETDCEDKEFWAKWTANRLTISYNAGTGGGGTAPPTPTSADYGESVEIPINTFTPPTDYKFERWAVTGTGTATTYHTAGETVSAAALHTLLGNGDASVLFTAQWIPMTAYSITYNYNGGEKDEDVEMRTSFLEGFRGFISLFDAVRTGYTFKGWFADAEFETARVDTLHIVDTPSEEWDYTPRNFEFWAKWEIITYTVTFDTGSVATTTYQYIGFNHLCVVPPVPELLYHTFAGWYADDGFVDEWDFETLIVDDTTIYGRFERVRVSVTFESDGAEFDVVVFDLGNKLPRPSGSPHKAGYAFGGWFKTAECDDGDEWDFDNTYVLVGGDFTLFARWDIYKFVVVFVVNGGSAVESELVDWNTVVGVPSPEPTRAGHMFGGWWADAEFEDLYDFETPVTDDIEIFAKWVILVFNVNFYDGDEVVFATTVEWGNPILPFDAVVPNGFRFGGWWADAAFENAYDFNAVVTADFDLFAKWNAIPTPIIEKILGILMENLVYIIAGVSAVVGLVVISKVRKVLKKIKVKKLKSRAKTALEQAGAALQNAMEQVTTHKMYPDDFAQQSKAMKALRETGEKMALAQTAVKKFKKARGKRKGERGGKGEKAGSERGAGRDASKDGVIGGVAPDTAGQFI